PRRQYGVLVEPRVQLRYGFVAPSTNRPPCRTPHANYTRVSCAAGRAKRGGATEMKRSCLGRHRGDLVADLLKSADQAAGGFGGVGAIEVGGAEVVPLGAVAQHVPGRGEHRGGHGDDGFLGAAARTQTMELWLQVAALDLDC